MNKRFQYNIATGRFTLLVASIIATALFLPVYENKDNLIMLGVGALITYLIIEFNRVFAIIRTRTFLPSALFILYYAGCPSLMDYSQRQYIPLLAMLAMFALFNSHNKKNASSDVFNAFLCLSVGSMINPYLLYFVPILYMCMMSLHSINFRSFIAGLIGLTAPYIIYAIVYILTDRPALDVLNLLSPIADQPVFGTFPIIAFEDICYGIMVLAVSFMGSVMNVVYNHKIKEECRRLIRTLLIIEFGILVVTILQPVLFYPSMTMMAIIGSILNGHLFTIENNRFTRIYLIIVIVLFITCSTANLWIHLYNS